MRLWALSDLHVSHAENRLALDDLPAFPDDWLILAGDVTHGPERLDWCFGRLAPRFRQIVWVPGNHELWTVPRTPPRLGGVALYERLVEVARSHGVLTPEDPYPVVEHPVGPVLVAPLFLLYDYSFRPRHIGRDEVLRWAREDGAVCSDEYMLHPDPYPDRDSWCAARCRDTASRLASYPTDLPKVLINHFPLEEEHAVLPRIPRFTPWCGTRRTRGWHQRFNACAVVYGHLHIQGTQWLDGVPFEEVSLGYPGQWDRGRGIGAYLREVTPAVRGAAVR
ncbi:MAG: metallophosphoesterase [Gemmatimonadetes bacterium]|nr:metallophosphoesterase [Gemmatimonadota bacterium]MYI06024.1 metallophosphoesterase [Gemmatimonadota bacterium]